MGGLWWEKDFFNDTWHNTRVLLVSSKVHREDIFLHFFSSHVEQLHCVWLVGLSRPVPLNRLWRFFIFFTCRRLSCCFFRLFIVVWSGIQLAKCDFNVFASFLVKFIWPWVKLLYFRLAWNHRKTIFEHVKNLIKVDVEIGFFLRFLLKEIFELCLFFVDFKSIHIVFTFVIREEFFVSGVVFCIGLESS